MKNLVLTLALTLSAANTMAACSNPEAQFVGVVSETKKSEYYQVLEQCFFKIQFTDYKASGVCPLDEATATEAWYEDATCNLHHGSSVSGYLVVKDGEIVIE